MIHSVLTKKSWDSSRLSQAYLKNTRRQSIPHGDKCNQWWHGLAQSCLGHMITSPNVFPLKEDEEEAQQL